MALVLYDWGPSPFCLKIRALLEYKQLAYERRPVLGPALFDLRRRGRIGKVPALDIDGELVCDSTDIAYAIERRAPAPPILPTSPRDRALCHALEDWCDEALYFVALYLHWWDPEGLAQVPRAFRGPLGRVAFPIYRRRVHRQLVGQGIARKPVAHVHADLERELAAIEALLAGRRFLLGDAPLLCDFALLGELVYLSKAPVGARALDGRAAIAAFLERMKALRSASPEPARAANR